MVILDTSIIIDHLRQSDKSSQLLKLGKILSKDHLCLSVISVQELYEGKSVSDPTKEKDLLAVITPLKILPYTYEIAKYAGEIARNYDNNYSIDLADAAIAATAIVNQCELATLNPKDFANIPRLNLFQIS